MLGVNLALPQIAAASRPFSPATLFASGEQGVWYEPSDFSTMYQNSFGTTPVTAVDQPVGLILDKRKGLTLGSELVSNGNFSNGGTGWYVGGGWTVSSGAASTAAGFTDVLYQDITVVAGRTYQIAFDLSGVSGGGVLPSLFGGTIVFGPTLTAAQRHVIHLVAASGNTALRFFKSAAGAAFTLDNISVKELPGNHATQSTDPSRPFLKQDGNGKYYLLFDGTDDSLATGAIDFTSTDKMSIFAGVRKLSDAATFMILAELGTNWTNSGSFGMFAPGEVGTYYWGSTGSASAAAHPSGFAAPITNVVTGIGDIGADMCICRVNGTQVGSSAGDQGTGNYRSAALNIGRRNNASSPFNGRLYSLIVRGAQSSAAQIVSAETYVNSKTGAY